MTDELSILPGPAVGAEVIVTRQDGRANLASRATIVRCSTFVVCVLVLRRGVVGEIEQGRAKKP